MDVRPYAYGTWYQTDFSDSVDETEVAFIRRE